MDRLSMLTMPDYGINSDGIRSFTVNSVISGRGPDRLKYLDMAGRWNLNGQSVKCISAAFKHLERLNDAQCAFRIFSDEPLNAIGMVGWKASETPEKKEAKPTVVLQPKVEYIEEEVPRSPREPVPHRSAGYGLAHQKRKLTVPGRSRSTSPSTEPSPRDYDRKKETTSPSEGRSSRGDLGYSSSDERYGSKSPYNERPPHRTQALSPIVDSTHRKYDSEYSPHSIFNHDHHYGDELMISVKETTRQPPYRTTGYGEPHLPRQYDISPKSLPSTDYSSISEQGSPYARNIDDVLVTTYHMMKTTRREQQTPRRTAIY